MTKEIFSENNTEILNNREKILSNCAFQRFAGGFEIYQDLINHGSGSINRNIVIERMRELYKPKFDNLKNDRNESNDVLRSSLAGLVNSTLQEGESGNFSINNFAEKISLPPLYDLFSAEWNHKAGDDEKDSGNIYVNEVVAYKIENDDAISLHLRPSNVEGKNINEKRLEGHRIIAEKIKNGEIKEKTIIIKSWLFGRDVEDKTRQIFGDDIVIEDVPRDDEQYESIQFLALQYNNRVLKKYLETGEKPEIRQIVMSSQEFLQKFDR
jgi:hypothetical protein